MDSSKHRTAPVVIGLCPACGRRLPISPADSGLKMVCTACGHAFVVPTAAARPAPVATATWYPQPKVHKPVVPWVVGASVAAVLIAGAALALRTSRPSASAPAPGPAHRPPTATR
jgi:hypothetical protein